MTPDEVHAIILSRVKGAVPTKGDYIRNSYELHDGRQIALANTRRIGVWFELGNNNWWRAFRMIDLPKGAPNPLRADQGRNANLPDRLKHEPSEVWRTRGFPRPVVYLAASSTDELHAMLDAYGASPSAPSHAPASRPEPVTPAPEPSPMPEPTNLILYGPPGTGKTYATIERAVQLCDGTVSENRDEVEARFRALRTSGRIAFITFHQTYGYEDFVEGLRPPSSSASASADDDGNRPQRVGLTLDVRSGIFKSMAERAASSAPEGSETLAATRADGSQRTVWKMSLGATYLEDEAGIFDHCVERGEIALGWGDPVDWSDDRFDRLTEIRREWPRDEGESVPPIRMTMLDQLRNRMKEGDLVVVSEGNKRFRAVGEVTGPYRYDNVLGSYAQRRSVRWLRVARDGIDFSTITQTNVTQRSLYRMSDVDLPALLELLGTGEARGAPKPHVLVIDEINRANVSKVFGELITLLEADKRTGAAHELSVTLPFSGERFTVPPNLHLIGTMNTADRSIALLDTALRRRFEFEEVGPEPNLLRRVDGIVLRAVLRTMNERIEYLFDRDHAIGHAYFMHCADRASIDAVMRGKIIPLLVEYFHEDWEKVRAVLGETRDEGAFIERRRLVPPPGQDALGERWTYRVRQVFPADAYASQLGSHDDALPVAAE